MNDEFGKLFSRSSRSFAKANPQLFAAQPESSLRNESVAKAEGKKEGAGRVVVSIKSFRCRLLDTDNLCPKYVIDALRYAGAIHDDRPEDIILTTAQEKVAHRKEQRTEITLIWPRE